MRSNSLRAYQSTVGETLLLGLKNYEFGEPLSSITEWTIFQEIDNFSRRLVIARRADGDGVFSFTLDLNDEELNSLREFLAKRKGFVINHILKRGSFSPYTHLYQLYLQYLSDELSEPEQVFMLEGYYRMLVDLRGESIAYAQRISVEKKLHLG